MYLDHHSRVVIDTEELSEYDLNPNSSADNFKANAQSFSRLYGDGDPLNRHRFDIKTRSMISYSVAVLRFTVD